MAIERWPKLIIRRGGGSVRDSFWIDDQASVPAGSDRETYIPKAQLEQAIGEFAERLAGLTRFDPETEEESPSQAWQLGSMPAIMVEYPDGDWLRREDVLALCRTLATEGQ